MTTTVGPPGPGTSVTTEVSRFRHLATHLSGWWRATDPSMWVDAMAGRGAPAELVGVLRRRVNAVNEDVQVAHSENDLLPPALAFLRELSLYANMVLAPVNVPPHMRDEFVYTGAGMQTDVTFGSFYPLEPLPRLAVLGMPGTWVRLERHLSWHLDTAMHAPRSALARAASPTARLAAGADLVHVAYTQSLAAVVWLQFLWAVEHGMVLRRCADAKCRAPVLGLSARTQFCGAHSAPPIVPPNEAAAYERRRRQDMTEGRRARTWATWRAQYEARPPS